MAARHRRRPCERERQLISHLTTLMSGAPACRRELKVWQVQAPTLPFAGLQPGGCDRWQRIYGEAGGKVWWTGEWERECASGCAASVRPHRGEYKYGWKIRCDGKDMDGGFMRTAREAKREANSALVFFGKEVLRSRSSRPARKTGSGWSREDYERAFGPHAQRRRK